MAYDGTMGPARPRGLTRAIRLALGAFGATTALLAASEIAAAQSYQLGDVFPVGYTFCPRGSAPAEGQLLAIAQNTALFSLYGTQYGGDGRTTFALPDLRSRSPVGQGGGPGLTPRAQGSTGGSETVTLSVAQMPRHSHEVRATNRDGDRPGPGGRLLAAAPTGGSGNETIYSTAAPNRTMSDAMIAPTGDGLPFEVQHPFVGIRFCVATVGVYPSRN